MGPRDVVGNSPVGVLDRDLRTACLGALTLSRAACREFALTRSSESSARQFIGHVSKAAIAGVRRPQATLAVQPAAGG